MSSGLKIKINGCGAQKVELVDRLVLGVSGKQVQRLNLSSILVFAFSPISRILSLLSTNEQCLRALLILYF